MEERSQWENLLATRVTDRQFDRTSDSPDSSIFKKIDLAIIITLILIILKTFAMDIYIARDIEWRAQKAINIEQLAVANNLLLRDCLK